MAIPGPVHSDAIPPDPDFTIEVSSDDRVTIEILADGPPEKLSAQVFVNLRDGPIQTIKLEPDISTPIKFDLPNGVYLVIVHGSWFFPLEPSFRSRGGISYAFRINVHNAGSPLSEGPAKAAVFLMKEVGQGDWESVQSQMTAVFQDFDIPSLRLAMAQRGSLTSEVWPDFDQPEHWQEELGDGFVVVRSVEHPDYALTLREEDEGLRFDPGPAVRVMADWYDRGLTFQDIPILDAKAELNSDVDLAQLDTVFSHDVLSVDVNGEHPEVSMEWGFHKSLGGRVALENISWEANGASGAPKLLWTTAVIEDDALAFPGSGNQAGAYCLFTLGLDGVPESEELTLVFDDIAIDGEIELSMRYTFPLEQFPNPKGQE
jgi:hypothetical protein